MDDGSDRSIEFRNLLARAAAEEPGAFDALAIHASGRLRALAHRMLARYPHVRRWEETDDVFQAALIRLHRSLSDVKPDSTRAFFGLAITQIRRTLIDLSRHYLGAHGDGAQHHTEPVDCSLVSTPSRETGSSTELYRARSQSTTEAAP